MHFSLSAPPATLSENGRALNLESFTGRPQIPIFLISALIHIRMQGRERELVGTHVFSCAVPKKTKSL